MNRKLLISAVFAIVVATAALFSFRQPNSAPTGPLPSSMIRAVTAEDVFSRVKEQNSPVVLINFWASWCEPCKQEFPHLLSLRKELAPKGLKMMFISIDDPKDLDAAEAFLREQHVDFQTYYKGDQSLQFVTQIYPKWEGAVPTTLLMGPELKILDAWEGDATLREFTERVMRQLNVRGS